MLTLKYNFNPAQLSKCQEACKPGSVLQAVCLHTSPATAAIHLGCGLLRSSSSQPGPLGAKRPCLLQREAPIWPCSGWGLPCGHCYQRPRCAFTAPFHPCLCALGAIGGILSVALSLTPDHFRGRRALPATLVSWSPDFPRPSNPLILSMSKGAAAQPPGAAYLATPRSRSKSNWNKIAPTCWSTIPSISPGRQRRWKASTTLWPSVMS